MEWIAEGKPWWVLLRRSLRPLPPFVWGSAKEQVGCHARREPTECGVNACRYCDCSRRCHLFCGFCCARDRVSARAFESAKNSDEWIAAGKSCRSARLSGAVDQDFAMSATHRSVPAGDSNGRTA